MQELSKGIAIQSPEDLGFNLTDTEKAELEAKHQEFRKNFAIATRMTLGVPLEGYSSEEKGEQ